MKRAILFISQPVEFSDMIPAIATTGVDYLHPCER